LAARCAAGRQQRPEIPAGAMGWRSPGKIPMPTLAEQQLPAVTFTAMCDELRSLAAKPTLDQVRAILIRYGVTSPTSKDGLPSRMAAKAVVDGPFARYVERLNAGRETREALCAAAGSGRHPLDAIEEAMVLELQDHLVGAEGGEIDIKFVVDQLTKLRMSISMREDSRRKQTDLERKQRETEARLELAERREALLSEQVAKLERDRTEWEAKRRQVAAQIERAQGAPAATADEVRAAAVAEIDRIMGITPKK
jgi:hypothetical protein